MGLIGSTSGPGATVTGERNGKRDEKEERSDMQVRSKEGKEKRGESEGKGGK
jgi:hypothetical protein